MIYFGPRIPSRDLSRRTSDSAPSTPAPSNSPAEGVNSPVEGVNSPTYILARCPPHSPCLRLRLTEIGRTSEIYLLDARGTGLSGRIGDPTESVQTRLARAPEMDAYNIPPRSEASRFR
eukprot:6607661-Pyramimonas_sp.AAC.1